jgi:lipoprotein-anchoring transpeptidase ErfK/SrfK
MGRVYIPPDLLLAVSLAAGLAAVLSVLTRPAAGQEASPVPAAVTAAPRLAPTGIEAVPRVQPHAVSAISVRPRKPRGHAIISPSHGSEVIIRSHPHGPVVARVGARTEFGSSTTLAVARRHGRWLGVVTTTLPNRRLGWVDPRESSVRASRTHVSLTLDLSARRLVVRRDNRVLRRMTVGIGRPSSPTPTGRFAVTDKLSGSLYGSFYGCCILALSAHQPNLPSGWPGGDRIAVHGTDDPSSIGAASSAGCAHARDVDLRFLMRVVPLGAPVIVRA